jgi:hypothetical protein
LGRILEEVWLMGGAAVIWFALEDSA